MQGFHHDAGGFGSSEAMGSSARMIFAFLHQGTGDGHALLLSTGEGGDALMGEKCAMPARVVPATPLCFCNPGGQRRQVRQNGCQRALISTFSSTVSRFTRIKLLEDAKPVCARLLRIFSGASRLCAAVLPSSLTRSFPDAIAGNQAAYDAEG